MKTAKRWISLLTAAALMVCSAGCGAQSSTSSAAPSSAASSASSVSSEAASSAAESSQASSAAASSSDFVTVTDHGGNSVKVPRKIERIAVCDIYPLPSVLAVFFDSGAKIVGMAKQSMTAAKNSLLSELYPDILKAETGYIDGTNVNTEELMKLKPDVVFYDADNTALRDQLANAGLAAVGISASKWNYNCIETLNNWIALLGQIFPENDRSKIVSDYSNKTYDMVQKRVSGLSDSEKQRIFFLFQYSDAKITTSGKSFFGQWWADAVGAVNVGTELTTQKSAPVSMEQITKWNPSKIFITNFNSAQPNDLYTNKVGSYDWSSIQAVQKKEVYKMPLGMYRSYTPGVDTPVTLLWFAKAVYPDLFKDIDITAETKTYYKTVFNITLTDEQAKKIFAPVSAASAF